MMNVNQPKRVAIYVRVSSEMQMDNYSLDAQKSACESFASLRGWQVVSIFREEGASAKSMDRPEFNRMMRDAELNKFDVILVHKLDRFSRKLKDMITIVDYFDDIGIALVSATEQFDLSTPQGKMMVNVMGSVNQWYLDNLAQEISKGKKQRAKSGDWNGTLSYGYTTPRVLPDEITRLSSELRANKITREDFQIRVGHIEDLLNQYPDTHDTMAIPHPVDAKGVLLAFEQYATGQYSFRQIADMLNESGYRCQSRDGTGLLSHSMISELLRNRFYLGETSYGAKVKGKHRKWMNGNHDAIIGQELFDKCQLVRKGKSNTFNKTAHNRKRPYPLSPMLVCIEQGIRWRGKVQRGIRHYLRARNDGIKGTYIKADELESEIISIFASIELPKEWKQQVINSLKSDNQIQTPKASRQKLERIKQLYILGDISEAEYMEYRQQFASASNVDSNPIRMDDIEMFESILSDLQSIWDVATLEEKDELAKLLFHKIYMREKQIAVVEPTAILSEMFRVAGRTGFQPSARIFIADYGTGLEAAFQLIA